MDRFQFHMDDESHWLSFDEQVGDKVPYRGVATITIDDRMFIGVSAYYEGTIPHETVLEIKKMPTDRQWEGE